MTVVLGVALLVVIALIVDLIAHRRKFDRGDMRHIVGAPRWWREDCEVPWQYDDFPRPRS
jgi:hypothetical protein